MIVGSGYSDQANFENATDILVNEQRGSTYLPTYLKRWTGQSASAVPFNSSELKSKLQEGCVAVVHNNWSGGGQHWVAILDYDKNTDKVYVSNPWNGDQRSGWMSISKVANGSDKLLYITNDGSSVNYGAGGDISSSGEMSHVDMSSNITDNDNGGYKINIDLDEEVEVLLEQCKKQGFKMGKYIKSSKQKEYLKNMIKAVIVTQYPDLRSAEEIANDDPIRDGEVQGCVKIKRYADGDTVSFVGNNLSNPSDPEDGGMYLAYKPYDQFTELVNNSDKAAFNYFSLDSSNNIVVAGWETMEVEISQPVQTNVAEAGPAPSTYKEEIEPKNKPYSSITTVTVGYLNQVSNYTVPFSLLWSLLVYGGDQKFVDDFAKLVIDTEIVIGCYDKTNTTITKHEITYTKKEKVKIKANMRDVNDNTPHASRTESYKTVTKKYKFKATETDTLKTDTPSLKVVFADTWTAVYNFNYKVEKKTEEEEQIVELEDELLESNNYQIIDDNYSGDRKPENEVVADEVDKTIEEDTNKVIEEQINNSSKELEEYNSKFKYRYTELNKMLKKRYEGSEEKDFYKFLQIKDVQSNIINMIISQDSEKNIEKVFSEENKIMLKYATDLNKDNSVGILKDVASSVCAIVKESPLDSELYNKLTKNGKDLAKLRTHDIAITSITLTEEKTKEDQKDKVNTETTTSELKEVPSEDGNVRWKVDKRAEENSFVKLLSYSKYAKSNLKKVDEWFFESAEETVAIADFVDLMKFLFQKVYKTYYGISDERIEELKDLFDPTKTMTNATSTTLTGNNVKEQVWNYLKDQGFTDEAAAGVMGNMEVESGVDPTTIQGNGAGPAAGICQWENYNTKTGRWKSMSDFAKSRGKDWTDLHSQLDYLMKELPSTFNTYTGIGKHYYGTGEWCWWPDAMTFEEYKSITDMNKATEIFCRVYERPSITHMTRRKDAARQYYDMYHGA